MQATLDSVSVKPFTKALTCLSKYGDDLSIQATPNSLSLSSTNSSMSAYCQFKYSNQFFSKYSVGGPQAMALADEVEEVLTVRGQLLTKALLSILKHRTVEKTVDRCELSIVEGCLSEHSQDNEEHDSLESKLIVRLYCKHGVIKTHRLPLLTPTSLMSPSLSDNTNESRLTIGPRAVKEMIDHFPVTKGGKSDPQLIWNFGDSEVQVKSIDTSFDAKGKSQLSTELSIAADEFDVYNVHSPPITIGFHLREFNATIAFAESLSLTLDISFTDPAAPLFIDVESEDCNTLFVIATSHVPGQNQLRHQTPMNGSSANRKRNRDEDQSSGSTTSRTKKPMKVVQLANPERAESDSLPQSSRLPGSMPPPTAIPHLPHVSSSRRQIDDEPLFLPGSQVSVAELGIENMDANELAEMLEGDGEEVGYGSQLANMNECAGDEDLEPVDETELALTQAAGDQRRSKMFRPLFED